MVDLKSIEVLSASVGSNPTSSVYLNVQVVEWLYEGLQIPVDASSILARATKKHFQQ